MSTKIAEKTSDARTLAMNRPAMARHFKRLEDAGWADAPPELKCNADETSLTDNGSKKRRYVSPLDVAFHIHTRMG